MKYFIVLFSAFCMCFLSCEDATLKNEEDIIQPPTEATLKAKKLEETGYFPEVVTYGGKYKNGEVLFVLFKETLIVYRKDDENEIVNAGKYVLRMGPPSPPPCQLPPRCPPLADICLATLGNNILTISDTNFKLGYELVAGGLGFGNEEITIQFIPQ